MTSTSSDRSSATASIATCAAAIWSSGRARPSAFVMALPPSASRTLMGCNLVPRPAAAQEASRHPVPRPGEHGVAPSACHGPGAAQEGVQRPGAHRQPVVVVVGEHRTEPAVRPLVGTGRRGHRLGGARGHGGSARTPAGTRTPRTPAPPPPPRPPPPPPPPPLPPPPPPNPNPASTS